MNKWLCTCTKTLFVPPCKEDDDLVDALVQADTPKLCTLLRERERLDINTVLLFPETWRYRLMTAFQYAAKEGLVDILKVLLSTGSLPERVTCCEPRTPLYIACCYQIADVALDMAVDLTQHGAGINQTCRWGVTALTSAVQAEHSHLVRYLCENGADTNFGSHCGDLTPTIRAAKSGNVEIIHILHEHGADVTYTAEWGISALLFAATYDHRKAIRALCQHGADINKRGGRERNTPLMQACRCAHTETVAEILTNAADVNMMNGKGDSAMHIVSLDIHLRCPDETIEIVKMLLRHPKINYDNRNAHGITVLHSVLRELYYESEAPLQVIELLVQAGCSVPDMISSTPGPSGSYKGTSRFMDNMDKEVGNNVDVSNLEERHPNLIRFCKCLALLLSAGSKIGELEWHRKRFPRTHAVLEHTGLLDYAQRCTGVSSLMRVSKLAIRKHVKKPLPTHVVKTGLPCVLQRYVLLEKID